MRWRNGCCMFFFSIYYLSCVICSDVGSPPSPKSGASWVKLLCSETLQPLWVKRLKTHQNTKAQGLFWWSNDFAKFYRKWVELLYVEAAAVWSFDQNTNTFTLEPPYCRPVPGWPLYTPQQLQQSDLQRWFLCKLCHSVFAAWFGASDWRRKNTSKCSGRSVEAVVVGSFTDIQYVLL